MHTHRVTLSFVTMVITCGLVLGGFTSPVAAHRAEVHRIVVTTLTDTADPPFNADGACGTGTPSDLPGVVANGTLGNTATVTQFKNDPCPQ